MEQRSMAKQNGSASRHKGLKSKQYKQDEGGSTYKNLVELKQQADELIQSATQDLEEYDDDVPVEIRQPAYSALKALKRVLHGTDSDAIQYCMNELSDALQNLGDATYEDVQQEAASTTMEQGAFQNQNRDIERCYPRAQFVAKLRRLADAIENGQRFKIQIAGERIYVPASAIYNIEHEREGNKEEIEFQIKWKSE